MFIILQYDGWLIPDYAKRVYVKIKKIVVTEKILIF